MKQVIIQKYINMKFILNLFFFVFTFHLINAQNNIDKNVMIFITETNDSIFLSNNDFSLYNYEAIKIISDLKLIKLKNKKIEKLFLIEDDSKTSISLCDLLSSGCWSFDYYIISDKKIICDKTTLIYCSISLYIRLQEITKKTIFE
jgi:hypothetical protein